MANYIKIEWWDTCDIGKIYYQDGFKNKIFLETDIGAPDYDHLEEGSENGEGVFVLDYQRLQKIYKIQVYAPEYLVDALELIPLHESVKITYTNGLYSSFVRNVSVVTEWNNDSNDCMALVTISFQQDDQTVKTNCCNLL